MFPGFPQNARKNLSRQQFIQLISFIQIYHDLSRLLCVWFRKNLRPRTTGFDNFQYYITIPFFGYTVLTNSIQQPYGDYHYLPLFLIVIAIIIVIFAIIIIYSELAAKILSMNLIQLIKGSSAKFPADEGLQLGNTSNLMGDCQSSKQCLTSDGISSYYDYLVDTIFGYP